MEISTHKNTAHCVYIYACLLQIHTHNHTNVNKYTHTTYILTHWHTHTHKLCCTHTQGTLPSHIDTTYCSSYNLTVTADVLHTPWSPRERLQPVFAVDFALSFLLLTSWLTHREMELLCYCWECKYKSGPFRQMLRDKFGLCGARQTVQAMDVVCVCLEIYLFILISEL